MQSRSEARIRAWVSQRLANAIPLPDRVDGFLWRGRCRLNVLGKWDLLSKLPLHLKPRQWEETATKVEIVALLSMNDYARPIQRCVREYAQRKREAKEEEEERAEEQTRKYRRKKMKRNRGCIIM